VIYSVIIFVLLAPRAGFEPIMSLVK